MNRQRVLRVAMAALTLAACLAVCWSTLALYREGVARRAALSSSTEPIFTREGVAAQLRRIAPLIVLWATGAVASALAGGFTETKAVTDSERMRELLRAFAAETPQAALQEERFRRRLRIALGTLLAICAAWALLWLLNGDHFAGRDLEAAMGALLRRILPPTALAFAALMAEAWLEERSLRREIAALKGAPRSRERRIAPAPGLGETRLTKALQLFLIGAAVALIALGVGNGGMRDVLVKAINICTECIGLG